jgi:2,3-dihydroxybenzoate decarboxylase
MAAQVAKNPKRFATFCSLSMHDAEQASAELSRCVKEYGMVGAMLNDFQNGPDGKPIYYDEPQFDAFWKTVQEMDVVVYIHPRFPHPAVIENLFGGRRALLGACWYQSHPTNLTIARSFSVGVGTHLLGLCTHGVFDRFPNLKVAYVRSHGL